jgi:hypothetical protein
LTTEVASIRVPFKEDAPMWKMPKFTVNESKGHDYVVNFQEAGLKPVKLTEGQLYVVKPGPWPHVGRKGVFVAPWNDNEVLLDENQEQNDNEFLFCPDPRSLEAVILH